MGRLRRCYNGPVDQLVAEMASGGPRTSFGPAVTTDKSQCSTAARPSEMLELILRSWASLDGWWCDCNKLSLVSCASSTCADYADLLPDNYNSVKLKISLQMDQKEHIVAWTTVYNIRQHSAHSKPNPSSLIICWDQIRILDAVPRKLGHVWKSPKISIW